MGFLKRLNLGEIGRQTIKGGVYSYFGVILGFVTTGYLFPNFLAKEEIGVINLLLSLSLLFSAAGNLGMTSAIKRMYPYFKSNSETDNGLFQITAVTVLVGSLFAAILYFLLGGYLVSGKEGNDLYFQYSWLVYPLILATVSFSLFDAYVISSGNAVTGALLYEVVRRILILLSLLGFIFFSLVNFGDFLILYVIVVCLTSILLGYFIHLQGNWRLHLKFSFVRKKMRMVMANIMLYAFFQGFGNIIVQRVDTILIAYFLSLKEVGVYSTVFYLSSVVFVPKKALVRISESFIARHLKEKKFNELGRLYHVSSIQQGIIGLFILLMIWINTPLIFSILPEGYESGKWVILYIGVGHLSSLMAAQSSSIIQLSKLYRWGLKFLIIFCVMVVVLDIIFVPTFGIIGAAIASCISVVFYQSIKVVFIWKQFGLLPISLNHLKLLLVALPCFILDYYIYFHSNVIVDSTIRTILFTIIFIASVYYLRLSLEFNHWLKKICKLSID